MNTKRIGDVGEECSVTYLKTLKYKILERNVEYCGVEVDIIAKDGKTIVFCEVKTRNNTAYGRPVEAVTKDKQRRYVLAAKAYLQEKRLKDVDLRFDVIEILDGKLQHIVSAFTA